MNQFSKEEIKALEDRGYGILDVVIRPTSRTHETVLHSLTGEYVSMDRIYGIPPVITRIAEDHEAAASARCGFLALDNFVYMVTPPGTPGVIYCTPVGGQSTEAQVRRVMAWERHVKSGVWYPLSFDFDTSKLTKQLLNAIDLRADRGLCLEDALLTDS